MNKIDKELFCRLNRVTLIFHSDVSDAFICSFFVDKYRKRDFSPGCRAIPEWIVSTIVERAKRRG